MGETVTYCPKYQITGAQMIPRAIDGLQVINETIGRHGSDTYGDDVRGGNRGINMEDDKVADMVLMIPNEDFSDETVAIGDSYGDDVRGNGVGAGHGG